MVYLADVLFDVLQASVCKVPLIQAEVASVQVVTRFDCFLPILTLGIDIPLFFEVF